MSTPQTPPTAVDPAADPRSALQALLAGHTEWAGRWHQGPEDAELIPGTRVEGRPNRCRVRFFRISNGPHSGRWAAFFYKTSLVPHSNDRYSYGAAMFDGAPDAARFDAWLKFLDSGFDFEATPTDVRRALTFTIPDFEAVRGEGEGAGQGVIVAGSDIQVTDAEPRFNAAELEVELFCRGVRIDASCALEQDARVFSRTRAGLGSGLELIVPGVHKDLWLNVPVEEDFAMDSPFRLVRAGAGDYRIVDTRGGTYPVRLPREPEWYRKSTRNGTPMSRVGVLQGTYLGIYVSNSCGFWHHKPEAGCRFCTTGLNVGVNEVSEKDVRDVVDVARAAKEESGNTFVHFNSGFNGADHNLEIVAPYVKAVKEEVGALIGVQVIPSPSLWKYDWMVDLGANHFSFCYEFHNPEYFKKYLPGKDRLIGQDTFFRAMEYCVKKLGKGSCSGEIIAGVEPIEDTLKAIDYITSVGAFPTVCIFRPTIGAAMERFPSPDPAEMKHVMTYMYEACRRNNIPIGMAPNIEVSLIVNPDDARELAPNTLPNRLYEMELRTMRFLAKPVFAREMKPRKIEADSKSPEAYRQAV